MLYGMFVEGSGYEAWLPCAARSQCRFLTKALLSVKGSVYDEAIRMSYKDCFLGYFHPSNADRNAPAACKQRLWSTTFSAGRTSGHPQTPPRY